MVACGGSSPPSAPTAPPTPDTTLAAGTVLSVTSGETGQPVAGAQVVVAGRRYDTDGPWRGFRQGAKEAVVVISDEIRQDTRAHEEHLIAIGNITQRVTAALISHELGHTTGLNHSPDSRDLMYRFITGIERFSRAESLSLGMLFERPGGNRFQDNDRDVAAASSGRRTTVCY